MAWIYLQASEGLPKPSKGTSLPSPIVKVIDTAKPCSYQEWLQAICPRLPSGMMSEHSKDPTFQPSILFSEVFLAKTFPPQDAEQAWKESEASYFSRSLGWLARLEINKDSSPSYSWKMRQLSVFGEETLLPESWPASGMTVDGRLYPLRTLERITSESDGGFWRTPDTGAGGTSGLLKEGKTHRKSGAAITVRLVDQVNSPHLWPTPTTAPDADNRGSHKKCGPMKMWPTPQAHDCKRGSSNRVGRFGEKHGGRNLTDEVHVWPTPKAMDAERGSLWAMADYNRKTGRKSLQSEVAESYRGTDLRPTPRAGKTSSENPEVWKKRQKQGKVTTPPLGMAVQMFPTPTAQDAKNNGAPSQMKRNTKPLNAEVGGQLNPAFVEWLMGYPKNWTVIAPWAEEWKRRKK